MSDHTGTRIVAEKPSSPAGTASVYTRVLDAPRELVWKAWTEPERFRRWWGPRSYTSPVTETDPRVGGRFFWDMRPPDGQEFFITGVFREVVAPERFAVTKSFAAADGAVVPASHYGVPGDWPLETVLSVTLVERGGRTGMTVREEGVPEVMRGPNEDGMEEALDKLAEYLKSTAA
jgi:uncharacterized protein YndB with AHSA1/START domain